MGRAGLPDTNKIKVLSAIILLFLFRSTANPFWFMTLKVNGVHYIFTMQIKLFTTILFIFLFIHIYLSSTVCPGSSVPILYINLLYKMGHYFLNI